MSSVLDSLSMTNLVGLTIIGEARGEKIEGQAAVGSVIRNRLYDNPEKYKSYKDVVLEPKQFSCWNESDPNCVYLMQIAQKMAGFQLLEDPYLRQCILVARGIVNWEIVDNTYGCKFYMESGLFNGDKKPNWASKPKNIIVIDHHTFFNI